MSPKPLSRHRHARRALCVALGAAFAATAHSATDLTSLSLEQLLQVTVVGASKYEQKQSEVAAAVSVITRGEIQAFGWRTLDQALASLPGIYVTYDRQYTYLGTRGFGLPGDFNTRLLVTINGNRINEPVYDGGPMGRQFPLDMDLVERIEFIPGPGGAVYGQNAMFGVVNVVTRDAQQLDGVEAAARWQQPQREGELRLSGGWRMDNGTDVLFSASRHKARGEDRFFDFGAAGVSGVAAGMDGDSGKQIFARVVRGPWSVDLVYGHRRKEDPTAAYFSDPLVPGQFQADRYLIGNAQYEGRFAGDALSVLARLFAGHERYDSMLSYGTPFRFPADGRWRGAELRLLYTGWAGHKAMLGLEAQDNFRLEQNVLDIATPANDLKIASTGSRTGVYFQDEWRLGDALSATVGLRVDRNSATGTKSSPRAALIWQAAPATTLKALAGRAHRAPNAYERDYDDGVALVGNPALRGETIDTVEFVVDQRFGSDLALRGSVYHWTMKDLIVLGVDPLTGVPQYQSGDHVSANGLEVSADKTWASGTRLRGSMSLHDVATAGGARLLNSPRRLARASLSTPLPWAGLRAGIEWRYDASRLTLDGSRTGGHAQTDLHLVTEALARGLELSLHVGNLFDKRYEHPAADTNWQNALEQDGRSVRLSATYRF